MIRSVLLILAMALLASSCFVRRGAARKKASATDTAVVVKEAPVRKKAKTKKPDPFQYGTPRETVLAAIKDRSELMLAEFNYPFGHLIAYQYRLYGASGYKKPVYYLYFMNDTLIRRSEPEPLRRGARLAVEEYYHIYLD